MGRCHLPARQPAAASPPVPAPAAAWPAAAAAWQPWQLQPQPAAEVWRLMAAQQQALGVPQRGGAQAQAPPLQLPGSRRRQEVWQRRAGLLLWLLQWPWVECHRCQLMARVAGTCRKKEGPEAWAARSTFHVDAMCFLLAVSGIWGITVHFLYRKNMRVALPGPHSLECVPNATHLQPPAPTTCPHR